MQTEKGWAKVHRRLLNSELWLSETFTKGQAWVDLFGNANHAKGGFFVRGNWVDIKRGQIGWSELTMAKRWGWSKNRVRRFLKWLQTEQQITQQKSPLTTVITIVNYESYQSDKHETIQQKVQQKDSRRYTNKNEKNDKEEEPLNEVKEIPKEMREQINLIVRGKRI